MLQAHYNIGKRPSGLVVFLRVNESIDQSSGVDRTNRRHAWQTDPRRNDVGYFHSSLYDDGSMEMSEAICGGNLRTKLEGSESFGIYPGLKISTALSKFLSFSFEFPDLDPVARLKRSRLELTAHDLSIKESITNLNHGPLARGPFRALTIIGNFKLPVKNTIVKC
jgi:hypothetical protein